jgi:Uma2 family endonuclease
MSSAAQRTGNIKHLPPLPLYRFSVDQYCRLLNAGILHEGDPYELLEGLIVCKDNAGECPEVPVVWRHNGTVAEEIPLAVRQFTVDEYQRMIEAGILPEHAPVELLQGWIVQKMPRNPPHDSALFRIQKEMFQRLPAEWLCRGQSEITTDDSRPEPDLAIVRGPEDRYDERHPGPEDTAVAIEVSDSTLQRDRTLKAQVYARARIPVYWIVNLPQSLVEVYTDPSGPDANPGYRQRHDYGLEDAVPLVLDGREVARIPVRNLLPRRANT